MNKFVIIFILFIFSTISFAEELKDKLYDTASEKLSVGIGNLIPGEGVTEVSIELTDEKDDDIDIHILGVRDLASTEKSNFFTQFSFHNTEVNNNTRFIGNIGLGYRKLSSDNNYLFGINTFLDHDINHDHGRVGLGLELKASIIDFSANYYNKITNQTVIDGAKEQVLNSLDFNISSQVPHMPWAIFNWKGYSHDAEKADEDSAGNMYSLELAINPAVQFDLSLDKATNSGVEDVYSGTINFIYPPKEEKLTMASGLSENAFEKANMKSKLKEKIRRNNNLVVEIQGAVIVTSK